MTSQKIFSILSLLTFFLSCTGTQQAVEPTRQDTSTAKSEAITRGSTLRKLVVVGENNWHCTQAMKQADPCDLEDNDGDGIMDPCCCGCMAGVIAKDLNGDGVITNQDGGCIPMVEYGRTRVEGSLACFDLNHDGVISFEDLTAWGEVE